MQQKSNNNKANLIRNFLENKLDSKEKKEFEDNIQNDRDFAKKTALSLATNSYFKNARKEEVIAHVKLLEKNRKRKKNITIITTGTFLFIIGFLIYGYFSKPKNPFNSIEKKQAIASILERDSKYFNRLGAQTDWRNAISSGNFSEGLEKLERKLSLIKEDCKEIDMHYYAGILYLYQKEDFKNAINQLECTLDGFNGKPFKKDVPTHLIIAYTGDGNFTQAKKIYFSYMPNLKDLPQNTKQLLDVDKR